MTLADQAAITEHDGQMASGKPEPPKRRTFTAAYKARILAAFDALPEGSPERGELLRRERPSAAINADVCSPGPVTDAASAVPDGGLTNVHRYLVMTLAGQDVTIDITFPGDPAWDGHRSMGLTCGAGRDFPAGQNPDADKATLEASYCDPRAREPFIAALALASARVRPSSPTIRGA